MMEEKRLVPRRRFTDFDDEWKIVNFELLADIVRGASPRPIEDPKWFDNNSNIGWLRISDVTSQNGRITYLEQRISELGQKKTRVIKNSHLLLSIAATVGKPVINYVKTGVHDGFLIFLNPKFDIEYMYQWLEMFRPKWQQYGQPGSQVNLNSDIVKKHILYIPKLEEQQKIGVFFKVLDDRITNQERKIAKIKALKSAYLTEMFPQEGETFPKRRFKGFEEEWELRFVKEIGRNFYGGGTPRTTKKDYWNGSIPWIQSSDINEESVFVNTRLKTITKQGLLNSATKLVSAYSIAIVTRVGVGKLAFIPFEYTTSQDFLSISELNVDYYFGTYALYKLLQIEKESVQGTSIKGITKDELLSKKIMIPIDSKEQQKIGQFFKNLDDRIATEERKLEKLKAMKESYLEEMFV